MFRKGDRVFDLRKGCGTVMATDIPNIDYPVRVRFDNGDNKGYTVGGFWKIGDNYPLLYHGEPQIIAPPEPKRMRKVWIIGFHGQHYDNIWGMQHWTTKEDALASVPAGYDVAFLVEVEVEDRRR